MKKLGFAVLFWFLLFVVSSSILYCFNKMGPVNADFVNDVYLSSPSTLGIIAKPIIVEDTASYLKLNFHMFTVEFYKGASGYNKIYDVNGEVLVYDDRMFLEYFATSKWKQRGTPTDLTWTKISDYHYNVTRNYDDYSGTFYSVTYVVKSDTAMKTSFYLQCGQTDNYRICWSPSGITKEYYQLETNHLTFGVEQEQAGPTGWIRFDWGDVYQTFGDITSTSVETAAQGRKADIFFDIGIVNLGETLILDPSTVGTSTTAEATGWGHLRKTSDAEGLHWAFYSDGTNMTFQTSSDGSSWSGETDVRACGNGKYFDIHYDGTYFHYATATNTNGADGYYCRGTPFSNGTINWETEQTWWAGASGYYIAYPSVTVDSSGYPWIGYDCYDGSNQWPNVTKSSTNNGTWSTESGFPTNLNAGNHAWRVSAVALTSQKMLVVYSWGTSTVNAQAWNGTSFQGEKTSTNNVEEGRYHCAVADGDDVHIVFNKDVNYDIIYLFFNYTANDFASEATVYAGTTQTLSPVLSRDVDNDELYCFWAGDDTAHHIYYKKHSSGSWDASATDWITEVALTGNNLLTCSYEDYGNKIGLLYLNGTGSPYQVRYYFISTNTAPTNEGVTISNMDDTNYLYSLKRNYTFTALYNDTDDPTTIDHAMIAFSDGTNWVNATFDQQADSWSLVSGDTVAELTTGSCTNSTSGSQLNATFHIVLWWNISDAANIELYQFCNDTSGASDAWEEKQTDYANIETDLTVSGFACDDDRGNIEQTITFTGTVYYEGSSTAPPDDQFTAVHIYDSGNNEEGNDASVSSGAFSVAFTAPSSAGNDTYNAYIDMAHASYSDGEDSNTDTFITDGLALTGLTSSSYLGSGQIQYQVQITSNYTGSGIDSGVVRLKHANGTELTTDFTANSTGWATIVLDQDNATAGTYTLHGHSEPNYGVTHKTMNETFIFYSLALQARDAASANLPREVTFNVTIGTDTFGGWETSSAAKTLYGPAATYVVNTWWDDHLIDASESIAVSSNTNHNIDTKIRRLSDGSNYVLINVNATSLPAITYVSRSELKLSAVTGSGSKELKMDSANWVETGQPAEIDIGAYTYDSSNPSWEWDSTNHVFKFPVSFSTVDIILKWTSAAPPSGSSGSSGGPSVPTVPVVPALPGFPEPEEGVAPPSEMLPPYETIGFPVIDTTVVGVGIIVAVIVVGFGYPYLKKSASLSVLWAEKRNKKRKPVKMKKRKT